MKSYYSKKVIEHFLHPKNFGKIKDANGIGNTENLRCGDIMKIYIKVEEKKEKEIIKNAKFETLGCGHAISTSDIICDLVKGKTIDQVLRINFQDIIDKLGPFPLPKIHCTQLGIKALRSAIEDYKKRNVKIVSK